MMDIKEIVALSIIITFVIVISICAMKIVLEFYIPKAWVKKHEKNISGVIFIIVLIGFGILIGFGFLMGLKIEIGSTPVGDASFWEKTSALGTILVPVLLGIWGFYSESYRAEKEQIYQKQQTIWEYRKEIIAPYMNKLKELQDVVRIQRLNQLRKSGSIIMNANSSMNILNSIVKSMNILNGMCSIILNFREFILPKQLKLYNEIGTIILTIAFIFTTVQARDISSHKKDKLYLILYNNLSKLVGLVERLIDLLDSTMFYGFYDGEDEAELLKAVKNMLMREVNPIMHELSITQEEMDSLLEQEKGKLL